MSKTTHSNSQMKEAYEFVRYVKEEMALPLKVTASDIFLNIRIGPSFSIDASDYPYHSPMPSIDEYPLQLAALKHYGFSLPAPLAEQGSQQNHYAMRKIFGSQLMDKIESVLLNEHLEGFDPALVLRDCTIKTEPLSNGFTRKYCRKKLVQHTHYFDLISQNEDDGLTHLTPLVRHFSKNIRELSKAFGKNTWKQLSHHSTEDILQLVQFLELFSISEAQQVVGHIATIRDYLELNLGYQRLFFIHANKEGAFGYFQSMSFVSFLLDLQSELKGNEKAAQKRLDEYRSSFEKIEAFGVPFEWVERHTDHGLNTVKGLNQAKEYAEHLTEYMRIEAKYKAPPFHAPLENLQQKISFSPFHATLLHSEANLQYEAYRMQHCVASYTAAAESGNLIIYHIHKEGEKESLTASFTFNRQQCRYYIHQVYGYKNRKNTCPYFDAFIKLIEGELNTLQMRYVPDQNYHEPGWMHLFDRCMYNGEDINEELDQQLRYAKSARQQAIKQFIESDDMPF